MSEMPVISTIGAEDTEKALATLTAAFIADPLFRWAQPTQEGRGVVWAHETNTQTGSLATSRSDGCQRRILDGCYSTELETNGSMAWPEPTST